MKIIRKRCWKCKSDGTEVEQGPGILDYHTKPCSVCRGSGEVEVKQDSGKKR